MQAQWSECSTSLSLLSWISIACVLLSSLSAASLQTSLCLMSEVGSAYMCATFSLKWGLRSNLFLNGFHRKGRRFGVWWWFGDCFFAFVMSRVPLLFTLCKQFVRAQGTDVTLVNERRLSYGNIFLLLAYLLQFPFELHDPSCILIGLWDGVCIEYQCTAGIIVIVSFERSVASWRVRGERGIETLQSHPLYMTCPCILYYHLSL